MTRPDRPTARRRRFPWALLVLLAVAAGGWWLFAVRFTDWFVASHGVPAATPSPTASTPTPPAEPAGIVARTGRPELAHDDGDVLNVTLLPVVPDRSALKLPEGSSEIRLGSLEIDRESVRCMVDQTGDRHHFIYDENRNGDLRDDPRRTMARRGADRELEIPGDKPLRIRTRGPLVYAQQRVVRHGELPIGDERLAFALIGAGDDYALSFHRVAIDLDRDGTLIIGEEDGPEVFYVSEKTVNIDAKSYKMIVDPRGDSLTLQLLAERLPDRPALLRGTAAAPFTARDLADNSVDFPRGRPTLLNFWSYTCHYCKEAIPKLAALAADFPDLDILIIADSDADSAPELAAMTARPNLHRLVDAKPVHALYRVHAQPRYHLVDRAGLLTCVDCSLDQVRRLAPQLIAP